MSDRPNVIVLIWDTVRARNTGLHGYDRSTTPFLQSLVKQDCVWYQQARAPCSWTLPSHASMFTGLYPAEHQTHSKSVKFTIDNRHLTKRLSNRGYRTGLFTSNTYVKADEFGISNPFDTIVSDSEASPVDDTIVNPEVHAKIHGHGNYKSFIIKSLQSSSPVRSLANGAIHKLKTTEIFSEWTSKKQEPEAGWKTDDGARFYIDSFIDWVEADEGPFFGFFNLMEAHAPYQPPPKYRQYVTNNEYKHLPQQNPWEYYTDLHPPSYIDDLQDLYDGCIQYLDQMTEELFKRLAERDILNDTLVIIAGDHGEGFNESGLCRGKCVGHVGGVEEELLHVPLVIRFPNGEFGGEIVSDVVSLKDIYSTVLRTCVNQKPEEVQKTTTLHPDTPFENGVLAQRNGITQSMIDSAGEYNIDIETMFNQNLVAYYETGKKDTVNKHTFSRDTGCEVIETVGVSGTTAASDKKTGISRRGYEFFDDLEPFTEPTDIETNMSEETRDKLKNLGYL